MADLDALAQHFEAHRGHLRAVAYRMLGSLADAEDAVQDAWLRLARGDVDNVENLGGWLTTVVSRLCLDMLRSRATGREELIGQHVSDEHADLAQTGGPEQEALLVDEVGRALLVVLDTLAPPERIAFVLHDMFAVPFDEIAPVVERTPATTKKLASRARLRLRGTPAVQGADLERHRRVVEAFLAASRVGDVDAVIAVLDPDVVRRADRFAVPVGRATEARGARLVTEEIVVFGARARFAALALVNGDVGIVVAPHGHLQLAVTVAVFNDKIVSYELIAEPTRLARVDLAVLSV